MATTIQSEQSPGARAIDASVQIPRISEPVQVEAPARLVTTSSSSAPAPLDSSGGVAELLARMRSGDRQAAAQLLDRYGTRIRRRVRGKLGSAMRRLFDSMDILSTLSRRLDMYVMDGKLQVDSEEQLWGLLFAMADHALIDKARVFRRLQATEGEDSEFAQDLTSRLRRAEQQDDAGVELELEKCLNALHDPIDRRILSLWLTGEPHTAIAHWVDLTHVAVRKRWEKIKAQLRDRLEPAGA